MELDQSSGIGARRSRHRSGLAWRRTAVGQMTNVLFVLVGEAVLLAVGVLIGSGLHTQGVDRRYREVAQLVRELREREEAMAKSRYTRGMYEGPGLTVPPVNGNGADQPVDVPSPRRHDAQYDGGPTARAAAADPRSGEAGTVGAR